MQHFAVVAMLRSGSTRLCDILGRHPAVACHKEIFHQDEVQVHFPRDVCPEIRDRSWRDADPRAFIEKFLTLGETHFRGRSRHGFKVLTNKLQVRMATEIVGPHPRLKKILLDRENLLACFASLKLATATGVWHRTAANAQSPIPATKVPFEVDRFHAFAGLHLMARAAIIEALRRSAQPFLEIDYEETLTPRGMDRVWGFLGLPASADTGAYLKTNARPLLDYFVNPEDVVAAARDLGRLEWLDTERSSEGAA